MVLLLVIALTLLGHNPMLRILAGITTVLLTVALYLTQSRGGQIALIVTLLFIITVGIPCLRSLLVAGAIVVLGTLGAYCAGFVPERFIMPILKQLGLAGISLTAPTDNDFSTAERIAHWISGINMFLDHPFFGVGIGNYAVAYPHYFVTVFPEPLGHAHNYYINIAAEAGIFGLAGFLLFLLATFVAGGYSLQRVNQDLQQKLKLSSTLTNDRALVIGLLAALLSVCVHNMVDNLFVHSMTNLFALFLVMLLSLQKSDGHPGQARPLTKDAERTRLTAK
jgi:O-antigen ligase